jgi:hypothetical protein
MRKKIGIVCSIVFAATCLCGCESLVRKFVRKPKESSQPKEVLLEPQEYNSRKPAGKELYDQYFLYWRSWQDEFAASLSTTSHKRQASTAAETLKNLAEMRRLLDGQSQVKLDGYIRQFEQLKEAAESDAYYAHAAEHTAEAETIRRRIMNDFSPGRIKEHLL